MQSGQLLANVSSTVPVFGVDDLDPATTYNIRVYVSTGLDKSHPILVSALTSSTANMYTGEGISREEVSWDGCFTGGSFMGRVFHGRKCHGTGVTLRLRCKDRMILQERVSRGGYSLSII